GEIKLVQVGCDAFHGRLGVRIVGGQYSHCLLLDKGQGNVDSAGDQRFVHRSIRWDVNVGRAIVTIHAVHAMRGRLLNLLLAEWSIFGHVFGDAPLHVLGADIGNDLALVVGGNVADLVGNIHVPVNSGGCAGRGIAAAGLDQHANLALGVFFVAGKVSKYLELGTVEFARPVAFLAGILRGTKIVHGGRDRPWEGVEGDRQHLPCSGEFRADVPSRTGA